MPVHVIDPIADPRWTELVSRHPRASVFHTPEWITALRNSYGYAARALTTTQPGKPLTNGLVFCHVRSWLTGKRVVSLPFSDHCEILADTAAEAAELLDGLSQEVRSAQAAYLELRPIDAPAAVTESLTGAGQFFFHRVDLTPAIDQLRASFHKNCVQRRIRHAERSGLVCERGNSETLLQTFFQLLVQTRRRHHAPPQPRSWFRNLVTAFGSRLTIHTASYQGTAVAALMTLEHRDTVTYKYGASDARHHNLAAMPLLFWRVIQDARARGFRLLDLGRTDLKNQGLNEFKNHWAATSSTLTYYRELNPETAAASRPAQSSSGWRSQFATSFFARLPEPLFRATGSLLYRHIG